MHRFARAAQRSARHAAAAVTACSAAPTRLTQSCASGLTRMNAARSAAPSCMAARSFSSSPAPSDADLVQWQNFNAGGLKFLASGSFEKASLLFMSAMREPVVNNTVYQYLALSNLGIAFRHLGKFDESRSVLMQSLHALKTYSQIHDGMIANLYREAALACESMQQFEEAEGLLNHSLHYYAQHTLAREHAASQARPPSPLASNSSSSTASSSSSSSDPSSAAEQSKLLLETAATHYTLALLVHKTATAAATAAAATNTAPKGKNLNLHLRLREAERHYRDALKMMRAVYGSDLTTKHALLTAPVLSSLGTVCSELADETGAAAHWMEAMTIYQTHKDTRLLPILDVYLAMLQKQDPAYAQLLQDEAAATTEPQK